MDILYTVRRKHIASNKSFNNFDCLHEGNSLCCISVKNVVAFSTRTELEDTNGKTYGSHVYVADLNTPWHSYKVTSTNGAVSSLEWDSCGEKLLIGTDCGSVSIWASREHVLDSWVCLGGTTFAEEAVISSAFFHTGRKISIVAEKKDSPLYSEKMSHIKFSPSVRCFGNSGAEGCLLITGTGIAGAISLEREGRVFTKSESLSPTRAALSVADIAHGKNGDFVVAVSNSDVCRVQCYRVSVTLVDERLHIISQALPSFFLHSFNSNTHHPSGKVSGLKFVTREDADSLVVSANMASGGVVEIWQLTERAIPIHRVFQTTAEPYKTVAWQYECSYTTTHAVTSVTTNKIALTTAAPPPSYVLVATADSNVHCLYRDNLKIVGSRSLACAWLEDAAKHQRLSTKVTHMDLTWLGCALVAVDSHGQLYLFKIPPILEPGVGMTVNVASALLDYCLVAGIDSWDVLVSLQSSIVDAIADRISDNFSKQSQPVQQYYYNSHLQMKMALARLTTTGQNKAAEINSLLMLNAVSTAFTSLVRPSSDITSQEKSPADCVASLMNEPQNTDIDKVLFHLECKEFTMETSTLQSLQQLIQWVADLALNILARLPEQYKSPVSDCLRDVKAINCLRSLLVIIRVWGLLRSACLPLFVKSAENIDVLILLFKLLSKLAQGHEPDETLLDECCLLPSQVMIPQMNPTTPIVSIASPLLPYQSLPIQLEFGVEPDCLMYEPESHQIEGSLATDQNLDTIRHLYLGKQPLLVKQCCRCGGKTQAVNMSTPPRSVAIRAWDQRWLRSCRCGGSWRVHKYS